MPFGWTWGAYYVYYAEILAALFLTTGMCATALLALVGAGAQWLSDNWQKAKRKANEQKEKRT